MTERKQIDLAAEIFFYTGWVVLAIGLITGPALCVAIFAETGRIWWRPLLGTGFAVVFGAPCLLIGKAVAKRRRFPIEVLRRSRWQSLLFVLGAWLFALGLAFGLMILGVGIGNTELMAKAPVGPVLRMLGLGLLCLAIVAVTAIPSRQRH